MSAGAVGVPVRRSRPRARRTLTERREIARSRFDALCELPQGSLSRRGDARHAAPPGQRHPQHRRRPLSSGRTSSTRSAARCRSTRGSRGVAFTGDAAGQQQRRRRAEAGEDTADGRKESARRRSGSRPTIPRESVTIRVSGRTVDIQALTRFMKDLEASPYLTNVQLEKSELALEQGKEVDAVPADASATPARIRRSCVACRSPCR